MTTRILRDKRAVNRPPWRDSYGQVQRTKVHVCGQNCPLHDEAARLRIAAAKYVNEIYEVATGTGAHAGHKRRQFGDCVKCSCGVRYQGQLEASHG